MGALEAFLSGIGLSKVSTLAGGVGAAVAALKAEGSPLIRILTFTAGFCIAGWGAAVAIKVFNLPDDPAYIGTFGFVMGYLGMSVLDAAMVASVALKSIDWKEVIQKALGKIGL